MVKIEREEQVRLWRWGMRFFLAGALTACQTPEGSAPFALGYIAAGPGGASLAGAAMGAVLFLDFAKALPFLAVAILIITAAVAFQGTWLLTRPKARALTAAGLFLAVEGVYVLESLDPLARIGSCLAAAGLTGVSAWLFIRLLQRRDEGTAGGMLLGCALLLGASELEILGFSPARTLLCLLLCWNVWGRGPDWGAAAGLGLGLTADLCGLSGGAYTMVFGLSGLLASTQRQRPMAALGFLAGTLAAMLAGGGSILPLLPEASAGMALFLLIPRRVLGGKRERKAIGIAQGQRRQAENPRRGREPSETAQRWRTQLDRAAGAFRELCDSLGKSAPNPGDENPAIIFDRAAEKVCRDCAICDLCWQKEYTGTFNALNDATPYLLERGRVLPKDFPQYFSGRCIHLTDFIAAVNGELSAFLLRRQYRRQLEATRRSARGQYAQLSELLSATAAGLAEEAVPVSGGARCQVGAVVRPREGETVCGDSIDAFQTEQGRWCLLLADGMGSGEPARKESAMTCRLLRQFLEAGIAPDAALKTLNSAMALRSAETGTFSTIDLCVYDPAASEAAFYKFGAAPSYLKKGGVVRRITGHSLPAGLRESPAAPDITRAPLDPGSFAVMVSDGAADPGEDEWLLDLLAGWTGDDPQILASLILHESVRREKLRDDCAIQVLYRPASGARAV